MTRPNDSLVWKNELDCVPSTNQTVNQIHQSNILIQSIQIFNLTSFDTKRVEAYFSLFCFVDISCAYHFVNQKEKSESKHRILCAIA